MSEIRNAIHMEQELLQPCPFCARIPEVVQWLESGWSIVCSDQQATIRHHLEVTANDKNDAVKVWNERIAPHGCPPAEPA
jgi:hypothetical protein